VSLLLLGVDELSQKQTEQLSPADLLSFARQSAMGMVSRLNAVTKVGIYCAGLGINIP
jgi:hypothetical protein